MTLSPTAEQLLEVASHGRPRPAIELALTLLSQHATIPSLILDHLAPVLREVGLLWQTNRWSVAQEHAATAVIDGVLGALSLEANEHAQTHGAVLVACVEEEHHTVAARMGVELLRAEGWDVTFLGASLPAQDLQSFAALTEPDAVVVSCTLPRFLTGAARSIEAVNDLGLPVLAAGAGFGRTPLRALRLGATGHLEGGALLTPAILRAIEAEPRPRPPDAPSALEAHLDDLAAAATRTLRATRSDAPGRDTGVEAYEPDVTAMLRYLVAADAVDDATVFAEQVSWLADVASCRQAPSHLAAALDAVTAAVIDAGFDSVAATCELGRTALVTTSAPLEPDPS